MEKTEAVIGSKLLSNLNSLIENTLVEEQKMEEDLDFSFSKKKKKKKKCNKKIKLHNTTRIKPRNF